MALTSEQIAMLRQSPDIDQDLVDIYEKNNPSATTVRPSEIKPKDRISGLQNFSAALEEAVTLARNKRQNVDLDFINKQIPKGAVTASAFTGLLANINQASENFTKPLVETAIDFAQSEQESIAEQQNQIRDLALSVIEAGGGREVVSGILNAGDYDNALSMAAGALNATGKLVTEKMGSSLVQYDPNDPENTLKVIFNGGATTGGGATITTPGGEVSLGGGFDFMQEKINDVKVKAKEILPPDISNKIMFELNDEELRAFLNNFVEEMNKRQQSIDPLSYYAEWRLAAGLEEKGGSSKTVTNPFLKKE